MYSMMIMLMLNFMSFFIFNFQPKRKKKKKRTNTIIERLNLRLLRKKHFRVLSTTGVLHWVSRTFSCRTFYVNVQASRLMMVKFTVVGFR